MVSEMTFDRELEFKPVTERLWNDLERLFGENGADSGCWCMWWRIKRSEFEKQRGEGNRKALKSTVDSGNIPGILAYLGNEPVAWCSVAPREQFPVLDRSRTLKRVDSEPVWSIVCFFVAKQHREKALTHALISASLKYAKENGARVVEAYPLDKQPSNHTAGEAYTGYATTFQKEGFKEVIRRSSIRPIMRYYFED